MKQWNDETIIKHVIDFSKELNPEQLDIVLHGDGPCLVLAGAGSGKTRTITYRVAYLLEKGVRPENILLVTFTNKAANEMVRRVGELAGRASSDKGCHSRESGNPGRRSIILSDLDPHFHGDNSGNDSGDDSKGGAPSIILPWAGTFHHIGYKILKRYATLLGYQSNFSVLDSDDSLSFIKLCVKDVKSEHEGRWPSPSALQAIISYARNAEQPLARVIEERFSQWAHLADKIQSVADGYSRRKKEANVMDFDDLLVNFLLLLQQKQVRDKFVTQFQYILVDEYQDTNKIQASIIRCLASRHRHVLVVGDDAQSIYSFRAAEIENILRFEKEYPDAKVFKLETNYRSSAEILDLANEVIANNVRQYQKRLKTLAQTGLKPAYHPQMDQAREARFVADRIEEHLKQDMAPKEIAVLFRAAYHSQMLELELTKRGIPYDYRGGLRFFERAHIKDVLAYLRIINNLGDAAAWMRVLLREEGIGPVAAQKIMEKIKEIKNAEDIEDIVPPGGVPCGERYVILGEKAKVGWENFVRIWDEVMSAEKKPASLIKAVLESPYRDYLEDEYLDSRERMEDIKQLWRFAEGQNDLDVFLAEASLHEGYRNVDQSQNKIILSTIHQAKGLEWEAVFIIDLAQGAFPHERAALEDGGLEEERRLFYVAITRAKRLLYLTYPMAGRGFGDSLCGPSMFMSEIDSALLEDHSLLKSSSTVFDNNNETEETVYVSEEKPLRFKPGSFLREVEDL